MEIIRLFIFTLKINLRDFGYWFWTLIYPLLLAAVFVFTTQNIVSQSSVSTIVVGVEDDGLYNTILSEIDLIETIEMSEATARDQLSEEEITAFVYNSGDMLVESSGIQQTIVSSIVNDIHHVIESDIGFLNFDFDKSYITAEDFESEPQIVMFFSLLGMVSFYSMFSVLEFLTKIQPNLSFQGARFYASPFSKFQMIISNILASISLGVVTNAAVLVFLMIVYQGTLFDQLIPTLGLLLLGNIAGAGLGLFLGVIPLKNEGFKTTIGILTTLFFSFTGGLAGSEPRRIIIENFPLLHQYNPIGQLTDTMYQINYMGNYDNYLFTASLLLGIFIVGVVLAVIFLRRKQYDSI